MSGNTPLSISIGGGMLMNGVCKMVNEVSTGEAGARRKAKRDSQLKCAQCMKMLNVNALQCSKCKTVSYCGRECQIAHWQEGGHKKECSILSKDKRGVRLSPPKPNAMVLMVLSHSNGFQQKPGTYRKPDGVDFDELFVVKVQNCVTSIMIYDKTRSCQFALNPGDPGFQEVMTETKKEKTWDGKKTFMKASFDEKSGNCTIFPYTAQIKTKYNW
jgi:hypothetical protein